jgi:hypothetical protein
MLFIGVLVVSALSTCSNPAGFVPGPLSMDQPAPLTATPDIPSTAIPLAEQHGIEYSSVAEALADLKTRDDVSISILQGWTIVTEASGSTNWSFVPPDHPAFPAVAKRALYRDEQGWHLQMDVLCEADAAACDEFVRYFEVLNEPINQFIAQQDQEP